jgi:hypothetical protein
MNPPSPSSRRDFLARLFSWRAARRAVLAIATLGTLTAAFYVIENTRGRRAWEKTQALITANGYTLPRTFADLAPPPVDPAENAAETPILRDFYAADPTVARAALERWKIPTGETITPALLDQHADSLAQLADALRRPRLRFTVAYEKGYDLTLSHVGPLLSASRLFAARAAFSLRQNDPAGAADDVSTILRLADLLGHEPFLISQLTISAISNMAVDVVSDGLAKNAWTTDQRARLSAALARVDLLDGLHRAFLGEWGVVSIYFENHPDLRLLMPQEALGPWPPARLIPSGWFDQARALMGRVYMENIIPSVDVAARRVDLAGLQTATREILGKKRNVASGHALAALIFPTFDKVVTTQAENQTRLDHARLALALADWRELHGAYPATLAELPPSAGLAGLHDLLTGQPYAYHPAPDRLGYRLHATGPDGRDDGGTHPADWIWPARPASP